MTVYFISDLHLTPKRPQTTELFLEFLKTEGAEAEALYILGDLFEFWIGDDAVETTGQSVCFEALKRVTDGGVRVYFMHGNRDFLIGERFARETGCRLLPDPSLITLGNSNVLLMHGDSMCTDDIAHQQFRSVVDDPQWQREFLGHPLSKRMDLALNARAQSALHKSMTSMEIMDVNQHEVERRVERHQADLLIHGHTHRPGIHDVNINGRRATRIVLGDWYEQSSVLRYADGMFRLAANNREFPVVTPA